MKKILFIGFLILSTISCKAQIIAVENFESYNKELPDGAYIKDVNNVLGKFVGTWKGAYNAKNYEFRIVKHTENNTELKYKEDKLLIRYKITDTNGKVIEDTTTLSNDSPYVIEGNYLAKVGYYVLTYQGRKTNCGQNGNVFISINKKNSSFMGLSLSVIGDMIDDCPNGQAEQILPTTNLRLTKQ